MLMVKIEILGTSYWELRLEGDPFPPPLKTRFLTILEYSTVLSIVPVARTIVPTNCRKLAAGDAGKRPEGGSALTISWIGVVRSKIRGWLWISDSITIRYSQRFGIRDLL
eukprot:COSAG02_NODE_1453_length_12551_cov_2.557420_6_plen_110_part_00